MLPTSKVPPAKRPRVGGDPPPTLSHMMSRYPGPQAVDPTYEQLVQWRVELRALSNYLSGALTLKELLEQRFVPPPSADAKPDAAIVAGDSVGGPMAAPMAVPPKRRPPTKPPTLSHFLSCFPAPPAVAPTSKQRVQQRWGFRAEEVAAADQDLQFQKNSDSDSASSTMD